MQENFECQECRRLHQNLEQAIKALVQAKEGTNTDSALKGRREARALHAAFSGT